MNPYDTNIYTHTHTHTHVRACICTRTRMYIFIIEPAAGEANKIRAAHNENTPTPKKYWQQNIYTHTHVSHLNSGIKPAAGPDEILATHNKHTHLQTTHTHTHTHSRTHT